MDRTLQRRAIVACLIGNAFEGLDFIAFGMLSVVLGRLYFPTDSEVASLMATLATFGVGYVVRPLGGIFWGIYADRHGRKAALVALSILMAVGTGIVAITPGYASIGIAAPIIIVIARLVQGFSLGGEFASATSLLIEYAPRRLRGFYSSWQMLVLVATVAIGSLGVYVLARALSPADFAAWGWRLFFAVGVVIGPIGYYIRRRVEETAEFREYQGSGVKPTGSPLAEVLRAYPWEMISGAGIVLAGTSVFYFAFIYVPIYAMRQLGIGIGTVQITTIGAAVVCGSCILLAGHLSDKVGRRAVLLPAAILSAFVGYPLFANLIAHPGTASLLLFQCGVGLVLSFIMGPTPAALSEVYPVHVRSTGVGLIYNLIAAVFGGLGPLFAQWLLSVTGDQAAPAYWMTATGIAGALAIWTYKYTGQHRQAALRYRTLKAHTQSS
jgi:MHS family proline/betaine transporter-like MFS transporter